MRTTLLNPTVWLLIAVAMTAAYGAMRRWDARRTLETVVHHATAWPVLIALVALAAAGAGSRAVLGFLSPGAYAEEVVAARTFLRERQLYGSDSRQEVAQWIAETSGPAPPWQGLPGLGACHVNAMTNRARFFTNNGHTPMLLLAGVPIVKVAGGRGLYITLLLLSGAALAAAVRLLVQRAGLSLRSREAILLVAAVVGWQPVLAGIRQGDAVLPAAGLIVVVWYVARSRARTSATAIAAAAASSLALPALGVIPALLRSSRGQAIGASLLFGLGLLAAMLVAGAGAMTSFIGIAAQTAKQYAAAMANYAVIPRAAAAGVAPAVLVVSGLVLVALSWTRRRDADDAFATYVPLGLMLAPVVWSQHLALLLVPAVILLARILRSGSSLQLTFWAALILCVSLPDRTAGSLSALMPIRIAGAPIPVPSIALFALWSWGVVTGHERRVPSPQAVDPVQLTQLP